MSSDSDTRGGASSDNQTEAAAVPFYDVSTNEAAEVRVRAGWTDGEEVSLAIDAQVPLANAQDQVLTAFNWWADRWAEILQAEQQAAVQNEGPIDDAE